MGELIDKIPWAVRMFICLPSLLLVGTIVLVWLAILTGLVRAETLPPYVSQDHEPLEFFDEE